MVHPLVIDDSSIAWLKSTMRSDLVSRFVVVSIAVQSMSPLAAGIRMRLGELSPGETRVARTLIEQGERLIYQSASEIAALSGAALSTVVRTCQTLGFKGFQDLKLTLAREGRAPTSEEIQDDVHLGDSPAVVLSKLRGSAREAVDIGVGHVDPGEFERAVATISKARRVLCLGVGTSAPLAQDAAYRMLWIGLDAQAPADAHVQHVRASLLERGDVALVVSHTGSTRETVSAARAARHSGAIIVTVTSFPRSPLTETAHISLVAASQETSYRVEALASRIAHLVVLDALWVAIAVARGDNAFSSTRRTADVISDHRF